MDPEKEIRRVVDFSDGDNFENLTPIKAAVLNNIETVLINSVAQDDKTCFLTHSRHLIQDSDDDPSNRRSVALKLLLLCCYFDAVECATSLLNGEVETDFLPVVNEVDAATKVTALQAAAEFHASRCVELLLKKRARTGARSKDGRSLLALEIALSSSRMDVIWNPDDYSVEDLVILLSEKDLTAVKFLSENTKAIGEVAYSIAMEGKVVALAALLIVAAVKVNESIVAIRDAYSGSKEKDTVYHCVIKEALSLSYHDKSSTTAKRKCTSPTKVDPDTKRKLLLCEIELLQLFGAVALNGSGDKKLTSPLIQAIKARDEAVIKLLLQTEIDVNDADAEGNSALHWSLRMTWTSYSQQIKIIWLLLKRGARVNQKDKLELTAFHIAAASGNKQALQLLLLEDPDGINYKTIMKETPLFFAVKNDHIECTELLQLWGANSEVLNLRKERPIDLAKSQDMRFILNKTYITLLNRNSSAEQKYTSRFQGDEGNFDACETHLIKPDEGSPIERINTNVKTETCKYFDSGGCSRGSKCLYAHGKEELRQVKQEMHNIQSPAAEKLMKRKIFVGGLHPLLDSDSLSKYFEDEFGSVEDARVVGIRTGDELHSRGFGFVTFKNEKSASKAVQAHYVTIMGKQVEIKSAVGRWDESLKLTTQQHQWEQNNQYKPPMESTSENIAEEIPRKKALEEAKADQISWISKLLHGQPKMYSDSISANSNIPLWLKTFKNWLPSFLQEVSKKPKEGAYPLSSLKADFRAAFGLELDHASLGYQKLSDFMRSFPDLCCMKVMPAGGCGSPNHMVLMPGLHRPDWKLLQPLTMPCRPSHAAPPDDNIDTDSNDLKHHKGLLLKSCGDVSINSGIGEVDPPGKVLQENSALMNKLPVVHSNFLQFSKSTFPITKTKPDNERTSWTANANDQRGRTEGLDWIELHHKGRHLVLEALIRKRNNSSIFFLRQFDFYHNYKASIKQGKCFWCNKPKLLWANFPCLHLLWCSDCKIEVAGAAGDYDHRCVICDVKVQKFILPALDRYHQSSPGKVLNNKEFPPFDLSHIQKASKALHLHASCLELPNS